MIKQIVAIIVIGTTALVRWFTSSKENLAFVAAWILITWAIVQQSFRGWSASIGIYLLVYVLLGIIPSIRKANAGTGDASRNAGSEL